MNLEVVSKSPAARSPYPPLLLIHGAWHAAWCWEGTFLDYFAAHGWEVHAMSLRGHGASEGKDRIRWWSIADYVADVDRVVRSLDRPPILVGHSMGGFVTQKYLETHGAAAAVLLASAPPSGISRYFFRILRRHPLVWLRANLSLSTYPVVQNPAHVREWFLSPGISADDLAEYQAKLQDESFRASLDMLVLDLPKPRSVTVPIAVLGAGNDAVFPVAEVEATARAYGTEAKIFPGMAHGIMFEPGWQEVAQWISAWGASVSSRGV
jgi:pimeloyl-ACP methyl ester carboxylesterase